MYIYTIHTYIHIYIYISIIYIYIYIYIRWDLLTESERERERERAPASERARQRYIHVCIETSTKHAMCSSIAFHFTAAAHRTTSTKAQEVHQGTPGDSASLLQKIPRGSADCHVIEGPILSWWFPAFGPSTTTTTTTTTATTTNTCTSVASAMSNQSMLLPTRFACVYGEKVRLYNNPSSS